MNFRIGIDFAIQNCTKKIKNQYRITIQNLKKKLLQKLNSNIDNFHKIVRKVPRKYLNKKQVGNY